MEITSDLDDSFAPGMWEARKDTANIDIEEARFMIYVRPSIPHQHDFVFLQWVVPSFASLAVVTWLEAVHRMKVGEKARCELGKSFEERRRVDDKLQTWTMN